MSWGEALRLTEILLADPSSMLNADRERWKYPVDRTAMAVMDLYDLQYASKAKRPQPYPRPWPSEGTRQFGKTKMTREEIVAVLNGCGHTLS